MHYLCTYLQEQVILVGIDMLQSLRIIIHIVLISRPTTTSSSGGGGGGRLTLSQTSVLVVSSRHAPSHDITKDLDLVIEGRSSQVRLRLHLQAPILLVLEILVVWVTHSPHCVKSIIRECSAVDVNDRLPNKAMELR